MLLREDKLSAVDRASAVKPVRRPDLGASGRNGIVSAASSVSRASVLITDEHYKHSLGIVRHLGRMGAHVSVIGASKESLACRSRFCERVILSDGATAEALVEATLSAVKQIAFDVVMPVSYSMTLALARRKDQLLDYTHIELPSGETIEQAADKVRAIELAGVVGVPSPRSFLSTEVPDRMGEVRFPVVIKPSRESPGRAPIRYARDPAELSRILSSESENNSRPNPGLLVQEYVPGYGCGFFATYQHGVCKRVFMHRRVREYPATGGVSSCAESFYDAKLEAYGRRMLDALDWHGVAMVEFRRDARNGEYQLMEINPKFWGSLDLALAAGADFPGDLCQMAMGKTLAFSGRYQRTLRFHWPFAGHGELFHLWTRPASAFRMALDFLNPKVKSNVWLSDLAPNLQELEGLASQLFRPRRR